MSSIIEILKKCHAPIETLQKTKKNSDFFIVYINSNHIFILR